jgi:hypothetical protein
MHRGWTKRWRKRWDTGYHRDPLLWVIMSWFIDHANHTDKTLFIAGKKLTVKRGQRVYSQPRLAEFFGVGRRQIRTRLDVLENIGFLTNKTTKKYSIATVLNYDKYQGNDEGERPSNRPTTDQQATKTKELERIKKNGGCKKPTPAPKNFEVTPQMREWAGEKGFYGNLDRETEKFLNHHQSRGNKFTSWPSAWRSWMLKAVEWNGPPNDPNDDPAYKPLN